VLRGISCPSPGVCIAAGSLISRSGTTTIVYRWTHSAWAIEATPSPTADSSLNGVSCATATSCVAVGTASGPTNLPLIESYTGPVPRPDVRTLRARAVGRTAATISGTIDAHGAPLARCEFVWGMSAAYGHIAPCSAARGAVFSAHLTRLAAGTTYHYRLRAADSGGTRAGRDRSFTTRAPDPA
jgi:hypothetical protein